MGVRVTLPPGCSGLDCADGTRYTGRKGGTVEIEDRHAKALKHGEGITNTMLSAKGLTNIGTKRGQWCPGCNRIWQAWSDLCPRCGRPTLAED